MSHPSNAGFPIRLSFKEWKSLGWRVKDAIIDERIGLVAAGVAFYALLALFPAITAMMAISGLVVDPNEIVSQIDELQGIMPDQAVEIITDQATAVAGTRQGGLGLTAILGILLAIYSASRGTASLIQGMNVAYNEREKRGFIALTLTTLILTLFVIVGVLLGLLASTAIPALLSFMDFGPGWSFLISMLTLVAVFFMTIFGLSLLYRFGPSRRRPEWSWASVGAVVGCSLWIIASAGFAFYVSNFGSYNESFGALGGIVVLLMWLWISAFIVLLGAELNAEIETVREQKQADATEPEPEGSPARKVTTGETA
ncbi:YihY family inner membrane protein [Sulfitobacter sp. BDSS02]|nr:YihY family inner membrane protein [Sulfitobacter sp. BDSS02]MBR9850717.1 YihY/virulence factor BrkB family protein [Paracoccaceae bacterium]